MWEPITDERDRVRALEIAGRLASEAGTKAWTCELDNQYSEIYWQAGGKEP